MPDRCPDQVHLGSPGQGGRQVRRLLGEIQPIRFNCGNKAFRRHGRQGLPQRPASPRDVVPGQRLGEDQIGVGVEAVHQLVGLVVQVAFHRVSAPLRGEYGTERVLGALRVAAEPVLQFRFGTVRDVGNPSGQAEPGQRRHTVVVVAAAEVRIQPDGGQLGLGKGDLLRRARRRGRNHCTTFNPGRLGHRPFKRPRSPERTAEDGMPGPDAEKVGQPGFGTHRITDGDQGKARPPGQALRIKRGRAGGTVAAAQHVRRHYEKAVRVHGFPRPHQVIPPAGFVRIPLRHMGAAGEGVRNEDGVTGIGIKPAPGFVTEDDVGQVAAGFQVQSADGGVLQHPVAVGDGVLRSRVTDCHADP